MAPLRAFNASGKTVLYNRRHAYTHFPGIPDDKPHGYLMSRLDYPDLDTLLIEHDSTEILDPNEIPGLSRLKSSLVSTPNGADIMVGPFSLKPLLKSSSYELNMDELLPSPVRLVDAQNISEAYRLVTADALTAIREASRLPPPDYYELTMFLGGPRPNGNGSLIRHQPYTAYTSTAALKTYLETMCACREQAMANHEIVEADHLSYHLRESARNSPIEPYINAMIKFGTGYKSRKYAVVQKLVELCGAVHEEAYERAAEIYKGLQKEGAEWAFKNRQ